MVDRHAFDGERRTDRDRVVHLQRQPEERLCAERDEAGRDAEFR